MNPPTDGLAFGFTLQGTCGAARVGEMRTRHGVVPTPVFMPVGTLGMVKSLDPIDIKGLGARISLANAFHLMLRPGDELIAEFGGLHSFFGNDGAVLTDSGGFQVFSLASIREISDAGVNFRSPIDGSAHFLSPERLVQLQENLFPDIAMVLDECPPGDAGKEQVAAAMARTSRWAERALSARQRSDLAWFGIVQGGTWDDLRIQHAIEIGAMPWDGVAIGGVSVGEAPDDIHRIVELTAPLLPKHKPRYLMGVGTPEDLVRGIAAGVDMFDCVMPSRNARNGCLFTSTGKLNIKHSQHRRSSLPVDESCSCTTCQRYSRAMLSHQYRAHEPSFMRLATIHNLAFYLGLVSDIRAEIQRGEFKPERWLSEDGVIAPRRVTFPTLSGAGE